MQEKTKKLWKKINYISSYISVLSYTIVVTILTFGYYKIRDTTNLTYILFLFYMIAIFFIYTGFKTIRTYKNE